MDVASFTRLGNVFASVMTGNIVLWRLGMARLSLPLASHATVAIAGYVVGVAGGSRIAAAAAARVRRGPGGANHGGPGADRGEFGRVSEMLDENWIENCLGLTGWTLGLDIALANLQAGFGQAFSDLQVTAAAGRLVMPPVTTVSGTGRLAAGRIQRHCGGRQHVQVGVQRVGAT